MRVTSKGQVTIPIAIRESAGLMPNTEVDFEWDGESVRMVAAASRVGRSRGACAVARLRGSGDIGMSTAFALVRLGVCPDRTA